MPRAWHIVLIAALYALLLPLEAPISPSITIPGWTIFRPRTDLRLSRALRQLLAALSLPSGRPLGPADPHMFTIKFLALLRWPGWPMQCNAWHRAERQSPWAAAIFVLCLPTAILTDPGLGQSDGFWIAPSLLALAARRRDGSAGWLPGQELPLPSSLRRSDIPIVRIRGSRTEGMASVLIPPRNLPTGNYPGGHRGMAAQRPSAVYGRQAASDFLGNAPNLWAIPLTLGYSGSLLIGYVAAGLPVCLFLSLYSA